MNHSSIACLFTIALGLAIVPGDARACSPGECDDSPRVARVQLGATEIPLDGVVPLSVQRGDSDGGDDDALLAALSVVVVDADGVPVVGSIERAGSVYFWRSDETLSEGMLSVEVTVDNDALDPSQSCGQDQHGPLEVTVVPEGAPALGVPEILFETAHELLPRIEIDELVCCDGGFPELLNECGERELDSGGGSCFPTHGLASFHGSFDVSGVDPLVAATTRAEFLVDGTAVGDFVLSGLPSHFASSWWQQRNTPFEARLRLTSLLDGASIEITGSADGGEPDLPVGIVPIEVDEHLDAACESPAYVCEPAASGDAWNPDACTPWVDPEAEPEPDADAEPEDEDEPATGAEDEEMDNDPGGEGESANADEDSAAAGCSVGRAGHKQLFLFLFALLGTQVRRRKK